VWGEKDKRQDAKNAKLLFFLLGVLASLGVLGD
jgi:hypothetical protein